MADALSEQTEAAFDAANEVPQRGALAREDDESLLVMKPEEAARTMMREWDDSWKDIANIAEQWKVNKARSEGYTGVTLVKRENRSEAHIPLGARKAVQGMNKAARLCRAVGSAIWNDPPKADATPAGDDDEDRDAAETSTRVLNDVCSEGNLDYPLAGRTAWDRGSDFGSGFLRIWVDETGGGRMPKEIQASPEAVSPDDPFPNGDDCEPILRYVTPDGQFTDDKSQADHVWLPKVKREILTGKHVRFIPFNGTTDIWDADGAQIGAARSLGELKRQFPELREWPADRIAKLVTTRPQHFNDLLPSGKKDPNADPSKDESMCFVLTRFHVQSPKYPKGCYVIAAGKDEILYRGPWYDELHDEPLDIPLTQFKHFAEEGNPYGNALMTNLGPGNEVRAQMVASWLEHLDRFNNRRLFVPLTSTLQAHQLQSPTGTPIPILPGGEPKYEEIPDFPVITEKMLAFASAEMDDESRLQQVGQGLNPAGVKSGLHANAIREQVQIGLSDLRENTERGLVRGWRIILQQIRAFFTQPQQIRWMGNDGAYKVDRWSNADLGGTKDVRIQRGTFTGLSPIGKANSVFEYIQAGIPINPMDVQHLLEGQVGAQLGLQDNPHRLRVKRQIAEWEEGPPDGWAPPPPMVDQMTGQPIPGSDPYLVKIWEPRPQDAMPDAAQIRVYELARAMAGTTYSRWPREWRMGIDQAFELAKQASQILTAEAVQKMQQELQKTKEALNKAEGAIKTSVAVKMADLDPFQTQAVMQQVGLPVPESTLPPPLDPRDELVVKSGLEMDKHKLSTAADLEKTKLTLEAQPKEQPKPQARASQPPAAQPVVRSPRKPKDDRVSAAIGKLKGGKK
jgi:hypothetical protein